MLRILVKQWRSLCEYVRLLFGNSELERLRRRVQELEIVLAGTRAEGAPLPLTRAPQTDEEPTPKPLRIGRPSYAEAQWAWEWNRNKRAKEIVQRAKDGFL